MCLWSIGLLDRSNQQGRLPHLQQEGQSRGGNHQSGREHGPVNEDIRGILRGIVKRYGKSFCEDSYRCRNLLRDFLPLQQYRREIASLTSVIEARVGSILLRTKVNSHPIPHLDQLSQQIHNHNGVDRDLARWAVACWADALQSPCRRRDDFWATSRCPQCLLMVSALWCRAGTKIQCPNHKCREDLRLFLDGKVILESVHNGLVANPYTLGFYDDETIMDLDKKPTGVVNTANGPVPVYILERRGTKTLVVTQDLQHENSVPSGTIQGPGRTSTDTTYDNPFWRQMKPKDDQEKHIPILVHPPSNNSYEPFKAFLMESFGDEVEYIHSGMEKPQRISRQLIRVQYPGIEHRIYSSPVDFDDKSRGIITPEGVLPIFVFIGKASPTKTQFYYPYQPYHPFGLTGGDVENQLIHFFEKTQEPQSKRDLVYKDLVPMSLTFEDGQKSIVRIISIGETTTKVLLSPDDDLCVNVPNYALAYTPLSEHDYETDESARRRHPDREVYTSPGITVPEFWMNSQQLSTILTCLEALIHHTNYSANPQLYIRLAKEIDILEARTLDID